MENWHAYIVIFCFCLYFFLLKWGLLLNHFVTQNIMINTFLLTHAPKTLDWYFAWQNEYGDMAPKVEFEFSGAIKKKSCGISIKWVLFLASIWVGDLSWISSVHNFEFPVYTTLNFQEWAVCITSLAIYFQKGTIIFWNFSLKILKIYHQVPKMSSA